MTEPIASVNGQNSTGCSTGGTKSTSKQTEAQKADAELLAIFSKYDTNKDGKISRKERKEAGLTKQQAKALNKASKAFNNQTLKFTVDKKGSYVFSTNNSDGSTTVYTFTDKNGDHEPDRVKLVTYDQEGNQIPNSNEFSINSITDPDGNKGHVTTFSDGSMSFNTYDGDGNMTNIHFDESGNKTDKHESSDNLETTLRTNYDQNGDETSSEYIKYKF